MISFKECLKISIFNCFKALTITTRTMKSAYNVLYPYINPSLTYLKNKYDTRQTEQTLKSLNNFYDNKITSITIKNKIYYNLSKNNNETNKQTTISNVLFNSISLIYNNLNYNIENINNFMCVGNCITKEFLIWYMMYYHNITINDNDNTKLSILDNNCNLFELDLNESYIEIELDKYNIHNFSDE